MLLIAATFIITLLTGMPIAFCLGVTTLVSLVFMGDLPLAILPQKIKFTGVDFFSLTAIPFFILAGELMNHGKITDTLVAFAQQIVGRMRGGLAHVNIVASMFFSGITGSAVADASALGSLLIPAMEKEQECIDNIESMLWDLGLESTTRINDRKLRAIVQPRQGVRYVRRRNIWDTKGN